MTRTLAFTGLVLLSVLAAGVLSRTVPEPAGIPTVQGPGVGAPLRKPDLRLLERPSLPAEGRLRTAALADVDGFSGGPTGTLLLGAALVAAAAFILIVLIPW